MGDSDLATLARILRESSPVILKQWIALQQKNIAARNALLKQGELEQQSGDFLRLLTTALQNGHGTEQFDTDESWAPLRDFLSSVSRSRAQQGFTPTETAVFLFSLKRPLFDVLRQKLSSEGDVADVSWAMNEVIDRLGLYTSERYQKGREEIINRQQQELLELSTPVVQLWKGVLALPLIGTLDSARTQVVMESLLQAIVDTGSAIAIIDITGVPVVDTLVAQHLLKTVAAARLMGADCIISGIRPQIAQTIVHLGVDIADVLTKATLADAFAVALQRAGLTVRRVQAVAAPVPHKSE